MIRNFLHPSRNNQPARDAQTKIIVGLGNPGPKYKDSRHNAGFMTVDRLRHALPDGRERQRFEALLIETHTIGQRIVLVKPLTMMNNSGIAVQQVLRWYGAAVDDLLLIYDDLDLGFRRMRFRAGGGAGGHNGVSSVIQHLNTPDFARLRIGIGRPRSGSTVSFVLSRFSVEERERLPEYIDSAAEGAQAWLNEGIEYAMNNYNQRDATAEEAG